MFYYSDSFPADVGMGSWPEWLAAVGTTAAFLVAAVAYARDVKARRWAQARLVHVEVRDVRFYAPGETAPLLAYGAQVGYGDVPWLPVAREEPPVTHQVLLGAGALVTAVVHNGSDEIFGPALVRAYGRTGLDTPWGFDVPGGPVGPRSETVLELLCSNPHYPRGEPGIYLEVTFRDSAGRWWRRRGYEPVLRARDKEREVRRAKREQTGRTQSSSA